MLKNFTIGDWTIDPSHNLIKSSHQEVKLEPQAMAVLCYLAQNKERPVSISELIEIIWKDKVVTDHVVYKTMTRLRKALSSDEHQQNYIKTISKKGYLLTFEVSGLEDSANDVLTDSAKGLASDGESLQKHSAPSVTQNASLSVYKRALKFLKNNSFTTGFSALALTLAIAWFSGVDSYWHYLNQKVYTKVSRLVQLDNIEFMPVLSNDNNYLLVATQEELELTNRALNIIHLKTHQTFALTDPKYDYSDYAWSSTGKSIIAARRDTPLLEASECKLVIIKLNQELTALESEIELTNCSAISSDADYDDIANLVYYDYAEETFGPSVLYSINPDTRKLTQLTTNKESGYGDTSSELSPDRTKIAFIRSSESRGNNLLMLYDLETSEERELMELPSYYNELSWTPDSKNILFPSSRSEVTLYSLEYGYQKNIVSSVGQLNEPRHSRNDESIISIHYLDSNDIYRSKELNSFEAKSSERLVSSMGRDLFPSYANNSHQFSYNSNRGGAWQIWVDDEQGNSRKITSLTDGGLPGGTFWSPDDKQIAVAYDGQLVVIDVEKTTHEVVFKEEGFLAAHLDWAADGKSLYFSAIKNDEYQIYQLDLSNKNIRQITTKGGYYLTASPDGNSLYFIKYHQKGLWKYDFASQTESKVFADADVESVGGLKAVGDNVYFIYFDSYGYFYKLNTFTEEVELLRKSTEIDLGVSISHDEKYVLWNKMRVLESSINIHRP